MAVTLSQPQAQQGPSGITGFLRSLISPIRKTLGQGTELGFKLGEKLGMGNAQQMGVKNPFLSGQETTNLQQNPGLQTAKNLAGIGSFFVPFGKGAGIAQKALLPGFAAGSMAEFGQDDSDLGSILTSGAVGAGTAGILSKLLGGGGKLAKTGEKLESAGKGARAGIVNPKVPISPTAPGKEAKLVDAALGKFGLKGSAQAQRTQVDKIFNNLTDEIGTTLDKSKKLVAAPNIKEQLIATLRETGENFVPGDPTHEALLERELTRLLKKSKSGRLTTKAIFEFKNELGGQLGNAFRKTSGELASPLSNPEAVRMDLWSAVDDLLKGLEPGVKELTTDQSLLHRLAPGLTKKASETTAIPFTGSRMSTKPFQSLQDLLGRGTQAVGKAVGGVDTRLQSPLIQQLIGQAGARAGVSSEQPDTVPQTQPSNQLLGGMLPTGGVADTQSQPSGLASVLTPEVLLMGVLSGEISSTDVNTIMKLIETQGGGTGSSQADTALNVVDTLQNQYQTIQGQGLTASSGGVGRLIGGAKGTTAAITQSSPEAANYSNQKQAFMSLLARGLGERGVLTDKDIERVDKAFPGFSDSPETAELGWATIRKILNNAKAAEVGGTGGSEVTGLESLLGK